MPNTFSWKNLLIPQINVLRTFFNVMGRPKRHYQYLKHYIFQDFFGNNKIHLVFQENLINNTKKKIKIEIGNRKNQDIPIKKSYRKRGRVLRIKTTKNLKIAVTKRLENPRIKNPKKDKKRIIPYSPKNKKTKPELPNSILKPLISSLSPSAKSKGARLVSETIKINQNIKKIQNPNPEKDKEKELQITRKEKTKIAKQISYLTV